ncbi:MAG: HAD family hydrolase [Firmicutes bacterium]|jgi:FMN phosphatase YigB (HAD superfamily)|nr:HAD family hydrolase [Bacillota bacterium]
MLSAVLFDLDGTLLATDFDELMPSYLQLVSEPFAPWVERETFIKQLLASIQKAMECRDPTITVLEAFSRDFFPKVGLDRRYLRLFYDFYQSQFKMLGKNARRREGSREALQIALAKGCKVVVATNPLFPEVAIRERLAWAGLQDVSFDLITSGEKMHFCKPYIEYYGEIADLIGCAPGECLMVGNDPVYDLAARKIGMKTFLLGDGPHELADYWGDMGELCRLLGKSGA